MPKKVLGEKVGEIRKVKTVWTFGDYLGAALIVFIIFAVLAA